MNIFKWQKELYFLPVIEKKKKSLAFIISPDWRAVMTCQWHCAIPAKQRDHFVLLSALERWWFYQLWTLWSSFKVLRTIRASAAPGAVGLCPGSFAACLVVHYSPSNNVLHVSSKNIIVRSFPMRPTLPLVGKKVSVCPKKRRISDYRGRISKSKSLFLFVYWKYIYQC